MCITYKVIYRNNNESNINKNSNIVFNINIWYNFFNFYISISKGNTVLRASLNPQMVSVIPNAVVANHFIPDPSKADPNKS